MSQILNMKEIFTEIYEKGHWQVHDKESVSGSGSTLQATINTRKGIVDILKKYSIKSILDIACGDFNWFKEIDLGDIKYIGGDIVETLIESNKKYETDLITFEVLDITKSDLPEADLLICRDVFVHLSIEDIELALKNIRGKYKYVLTTNFPTVENNREVETGKWRILNVALSPFNFPKAIESIDEDRKGREKGTEILHPKYLELFENI